MNSLILDQLLSLLLCLFLFFVKHFEQAFDDRVKHYMCVLNQGTKEVSVLEVINQALIYDITVGDSSW